MTQQIPSIEIRPNLHLPWGSRLRDSKIQDNMPAIFLDRDGVLNEEVGYLGKISQLKTVDGVSDALRQLKEDFFLVVVTNQSGIARGLFSEQDLLAVHEELLAQLQAVGVAIDAFYYCPHLPDAPMQRYAVACGCRKPKPGMLQRARDEWQIPLTRSFMIGDTTRDTQAGTSAGVTCVQLGEADYSLLKQPLYAWDIRSASQIILDLNLKSTSNV